MREQIVQTLRQTGREFGCRILFACESGSRAWGFPSPDSDFDVRFIYVHPPQWYLRLEQLPDTIDAMLPDDLDLSGWELRKTLRLFAGCNAPLNEWLNSPEVYSAEGDFPQQLRALIPKYFKPRAVGHHYMRMAQKTLEANPLESGIRSKKLFYILRPLLALHWIAVRRSMPPTRFDELLGSELAPLEIAAVIKELQESKRTLDEAQPIAVPRELMRWIHEAMGETEALVQALPVGGWRDWGPLNALMRQWVEPDSGLQSLLPGG